MDIICRVDIVSSGQRQARTGNRLIVLEKVRSDSSPSSPSSPRPETTALSSDAVGDAEAHSSLAASPGKSDNADEYRRGDAGDVGDAVQQLFSVTSETEDTDDRGFI